MLSGYLASVSLEHDCTPFRYYKKRLERILPTYWFCLVSLYIVDLITGLQIMTLPEVIKGQCSINFFRYFLFLQCFFPSGNWNLWNNHSALWTMSSFIGFYLLAPFLFKIIKKFYIGCVILISIMLMNPFLIRTIENIFVNYPVEAHIEWFARMNPLTELYCFLIGMVLYLAVKEKRENIYVFLMIMLLIINPMNLYQFEAVATMFVLWAVSYKPLINNIFICKLVSYIINASFTVYLIHPIVLRFFPDMINIPGKNSIFCIVVVYLVGIGIPMILYYGIISKIENNFARINGKYIKR